MKLFHRIITDFRSEWSLHSGASQSWFQQHLSFPIVINSYACIIPLAVSPEHCVFLLQALKTFLFGNMTEMRAPLSRPYRSMFLGGALYKYISGMNERIIGWLSDFMNSSFQRSSMSRAKQT